MKSCIAVIATLAFVCAESQTQWKHERLIKEILDPGQTTNSFINADGVPCYTTRALDGHFDAWKYKTNLNFTYLGPVSNGTTYGINRGGQVAWEGGTVSSISVNADGHDFYGPLFPPDPTQDRVVIRGIDDAGNPFWKWQKSGATRVFKGSQEISGGATISDVALYGINGAGDTLYGATTYDGQGNSFANLYENGVNITAGVLGETQVVPEGIIGGTGSVLWDALGSTTNGRFDLFLNDQNVTAGLFPSMKGGHPEDINSSDSYLWVRIDKDNTHHMMLGMEDLTAEVPDLGVNLIQLGKSRINDEGDVFWSASTTNFGYVAVLNGKNLTTDIVGIPTVFHMTGLDSFGNGVWSAAGDKVPLESVFVNRFDLSADAYGGLNYLGARSLAVGENGQVLWYAKDMAGTVSVWLSSPVPEPSFSVVPGLVLLAATLRRPRSRLATIAAWTKKS